MKETIVTFTCDNCRKKAVLQNGNFPFDMGWFRLDGIVLKIPAETATVLEESNVDVCSIGCLFDYLVKGVEAKGIKLNTVSKSPMPDNFEVESKIVEPNDNPFGVSEEIEQPPHYSDDRRRRLF